MGKEQEVTDTGSEANMSDIIVEEICTVGELGEYRAEVETAVQLARAAGFKVVTRSDCPQSSTEWSTDRAGGLIRLAVGHGASKGLPLLWDVLHELGHANCGYPTDPRLPDHERTRRERQAWDEAWKLAETRIPSLVDHLEQFEMHRDECLRTYFEST